MSDLIMKKNGTDYNLPMLAEHYPADRVYLDGDTSKTVQDECVRKSDIITNPLAGCDIIGASNQLYLYNFKKIFCNKRTPVLCWYSDQTGNTYVFIIFTGTTAGTWSVKFINVLNASSIGDSSLSFDGDHLIITGLGNWGYGSAIGLMAGYV